MQYRLVSDIHSELWPENFYRAAKFADRILPPHAEDADTILLLAGDTGSHRRRNVYKAVIDRLCDRFRAVLDIPGNHFWYGGTDWDVCAAPSARDNYHFGHTLSAFGVITATLWTDFDGGDAEAERQCQEGMNDFRQIPFLTPAVVKTRHAAHLEFLRENIRPGCIVMTHFAPSRQSIPEADKADPVSAYYASDLEALIADARPAIWVHGHIHSRSDYRIGLTRIVCNPAGYDGKGHDPALTFTV
ncbi:metallophosphoesterase [Mesorhizobium sophorae]|uniref:metallophosphoesterase n=1 Tax=Mesorhizobium sophorae TaxID=1300294 RepID=UPI00142E8241|nr:metallophosphoesterase [Mesorhizobium sophorae]